MKLDLSSAYLIIYVFLCLQMMPEIRVALFGANPNRKFLDWAAPMCILLFIFYFVIWKKKENVIPLVCETNSRCKRDMHCCCVMYRCIFLCIKGHDSRCISTLQMCVVLYCTAVMTGLLCCFPFFEGLGLQWFVTDVTVGCLTARFLIGSLFMTNTAFVSRFLPVSLTSYPHTHIISCMGGIVLLIGVCSNQSQMGGKK